MLHWWRVDSTTAPRLNLPLPPPANAEYEAEQVASTILQVLGITRPGIESSLPALLTCAQPTVPLIRKKADFFAKIFCNLENLRNMVLSELKHQTHYNLHFWTFAPNLYRNTARWYKYRKIICIDSIWHLTIMLVAPKPKSKTGRNY